MRITPPIDENVRGLEIAMQHTALMGVVHGIGNLAQQRHSVANIALAAAQMLIERRAFNKIEHVEIAAPIDSRIEYGNDVRMLKPCHQFNLTFKSSPGTLVSCGVVEHEFDCDSPAG